MALTNGEMLGMQIENRHSCKHCIARCSLVGSKWPHAKDAARNVHAQALHHLRKEAKSLCWRDCKQAHESQNMYASPQLSKRGGVQVAAGLILEEVANLQVGEMAQSLAVEEVEVTLPVHNCTSKVMLD